MYRCLICKSIAQQIVDLRGSGEFEQKLRDYLRRSEENEPQTDSVKKTFLKFLFKCNFKL